MAGVAGRAVRQAISARRTERRVMALIALQSNVRSGQREAGRGMVKGCAVPGSRVVALLTRGRETRLHVIRAGRAVEILHVARGAIGWRSYELSVDMALRARHAHVRSLERERRELIVIECRGIPRARAVAKVACSREAGLRVRWIVGFVEVRHVAAVAGGRRVVEFPSGVAGGAIQRGMR